MKTIQIIAKNLGVLLASKIVVSILGFVFVMYVARYLGVEGFGTLSFALALAEILGIFIDLGLKTLIVREVARDYSLANKYLRNVVVLKLILVIIVFTLLAITINLLDYPEHTNKIIYFICLATVFASFSNIFYSVFQAYEIMEYQSLGLTLNSVLMLFGALLVISYGFDILGFAYVYLVVSMIVLFFNVCIYLLKFGMPEIGIDWSFWRPTVREALPFGLIGISGMIYTYIDTIMLSAMKGDEVVGWYSAAYRLVLSLLFIPVVINTAIFPKMSQSYIGSQKSLRLIYKKYFKFMITLAIPMGIGTTMMAREIIIYIYGADYVNSIIALQILIWTSVLTFAGTAFIKVIESINKQFIITDVSIKCVIVNVFLNIVLIPTYSYIGASIATVVTELFLIGSIFIATYKLNYAIPAKQIITDLLRIISASLIMSIFIWYSGCHNLVLIIPLATIIFFITIYTMGGIDDDDLQIIRQIILTEGGTDSR